MGLQIFYLFCLILLPLISCQYYSNPYEQYSSPYPSQAQYQQSQPQYQQPQYQPQYAPSRRDPFSRALQEDVQQPQYQQNSIASQAVVSPQQTQPQAVENNGVVRGGFSVQNGSYILRWEVNAPYITFTASRRGVGFVGFAVSPSGGMSGADIYIAGIDPSGRVFANDYHHGFQNGQPAALPDVQQDYQALDVSESQGYTTTTFRRLLDTRDAEDHPIVAGENNILWSVGPSSRTLAYHGPGNRGLVSVDLLNPPQHLRVD